jgi:hypothetical protein
VWSASDMETLAIWSAEVGCRCGGAYTSRSDRLYKKLDPILDYGDVRQFRVEEQWSTDYIIDAGWFDSPQLSPFNSPGWGIWLGSNLCVRSPASLDRELTGRTQWKSITNRCTGREEVEIALRVEWRT